jgi:nucleoid-associated protein YgaU
MAMNRNWVQIFVGATALTGAFFFGSVMQRRHGDLDKKTAAQPMLEDEDLVWQKTPSLTTEESNPRPQPMVSEQDTTAKPDNAAAEKANPAQSRSSVLDSASKPEAGEQIARKVVQPDFSRWANSAPPTGANESVAEAAPMLPLGKTPPLLDQPSRPSGPVSPAPSRSLDQPLALSPEPTPEHDPWTAPLSSVLLKPPVARSEETRLPPNAAAAIPGSQTEATPAPMLPAAAAPASNAPGPATQAATNSLVPVRRPGTKKLEVDTDSFRIHVVRAGDTLQSLAQKYYGKADFYLDIYLANQDQLTSPINLPAGKALKIPDYSK